MRHHESNPINHLSGGQVVKDTILKHKTLHFVQGILLLSHPVGAGALTIAANRLGLTVPELEKLIADFKSMQKGGQDG